VGGRASALDRSLRALNPLQLVGSRLHVNLHPQILQSTAYFVGSVRNFSSDFIVSPRRSILANGFCKNVATTELKRRGRQNERNLSPRFLSKLGRYPHLLVIGKPPFDELVNGVPITTL
jgi:hypothetical protein